MNIWLPYINTQGGTDVSTRRLAEGLAVAGHKAVAQRFSGRLQYLPWALKGKPPPDNTEIVLASNLNAFAFQRPGTKLTLRISSFFLDPTYSMSRASFKGIYYNTLLRYFDTASFRASDAVVAQSAYTARVVSNTLNVPRPQVIWNGIDTDFFSPDPKGKAPIAGRPVRLLFVGNLLRRKGADMLAEIMQELGPSYELNFTTGWRCDVELPTQPNMKPLGLLSHEGTRIAYRRADILLYPTRLESFANPVVEAMACGTPAVTCDGFCMPEIVDDGATGRLCPTGDVESFVQAIRDLAHSPETLEDTSKRARAAAVKRFGFERMVAEYVNLFERVLAHA